eukprot:COSAG03_NODE_4107_length_1682_cov_3.004422_1_plen_159_part_10
MRLWVAMSCPLGALSVSIALGGAACISSGCCEAKYSLTFPRHMGHGISAASGSLRAASCSQHSVQQKWLHGEYPCVCGESRIRLSRDHSTILYQSTSIDLVPTAPYPPVPLAVRLAGVGAMAKKGRRGGKETEGGGDRGKPFDAGAVQTLRRAGGGPKF